MGHGNKSKDKRQKGQKNGRLRVKIKKMVQTKDCSANLSLKIRTQTRHDGEICKVAGALCKRSSATDSLSVALIIPHVRVLRRSLYLFYAAYIQVERQRDKIQRFPRLVFLISAVR